MRNLRIFVIILFLFSSVAFSAFFAYDRLMMDHTAPQIICDGQPLTVSVKASDAELCSGLNAYDDVDGDITDRIVVRKVSQLVSDNVAQISYVVFDSSSNICSFSRYVQYTDYHKPRFSITQPLIYKVNSTITLDDRLHATDTIDGDISSRIRVDASHLTNAVEGEYVLPVRVTNSSGDTANIDLTVLIKNYTSRHPFIRLSDYLIYVERGAELTDEELRSYIVAARESFSGSFLDDSDIQITNLADTSQRGSYNVYLSYTNQEGLSYTVILTVVVE